MFSLLFFMDQFLVPEAKFVLLLLFFSVHLNLIKYIVILYWGVKNVVKNIVKTVNC